MLSAADWRQLNELYLELVDLPESAREARLAERILPAHLAGELRGMLDAERTEASPLDQPVVVALGTRTSMPQRVGAYRLIREIGRGGMGVVYEAAHTDESLARKVAVKLLKRGMDSDEIIARFMRERQILASLEHPNIIRLYDGGRTDDGRPYFLMEYVDGVPIDRYCIENRLSVSDRLRLFRKVCEVVHVAHQGLVVHRDLKPRNILVTADGEPKLLDFGIAKLVAPDTGEAVTRTREGAELMTPEYASPEQVLGQRISTATDIYSLGIRLCELVTGQRPYRFAERTMEEVRRVVCEQGPARPSSLLAGRQRFTGQPARGAGANSGQQRDSDSFPPRRLPRELDAIVMVALRRAPVDRYLTASDLARDIERHLTGRPVAAVGDAAWYRARTFVRRHRWAVLAAVALAAVLVGFSWHTYQQNQRLRAEQRRLGQVVDFLVDVFSSDGLDRSRAIRPVDLLDRAARTLEHGRATEPLARAAMLLSLGQAYARQEHHDKALPLLREARAMPSAPR